MKFNKISVWQRPKRRRYQRVYIKFRSLHELLKGLAPNESAAVLDKTKRFMNLDVKPHPPKDKHNKFTQQLTQLDIVHCHFTGIGFEWDLPHYAVVWDVSPYFDSVMVIPTTSEFREEYIDIFSVGQIKGLPKGDTYLLISDMTRVSRKRLEEITYTHPKYGLRKARLPQNWTSRILHGIAARYMNCTSFEDIIMNECGVAIVDNLAAFMSLRHKAVIEHHYDHTTHLLRYRIWN